MLSYLVAASVMPPLTRCDCLTCSDAGRSDPVAADSACCEYILRTCGLHPTCLAMTATDRHEHKSIMAAGHYLSVGAHPDAAGGQPIRHVSRHCALRADGAAAGRLASLLPRPGTLNGAHRHHSKPVCACHAGCWQSASTAYQRWRTIAASRLLILYFYQST